MKTLSLGSGAAELDLDVLDCKHPRPANSGMLLRTMMSAERAPWLKRRLPFRGLFCLGCVLC